MRDKKIKHIQQFYELLEQMERKIGGKRVLTNSERPISLPDRGVYFFFEQGEKLTMSGNGLRCVRVGTHALKADAKSTLWKRLRQHRGNIRGRNPGGGNHRGSVFRYHVGTALIERDNWSDKLAENWGGSNAPRQIKDAEVPLEKAISNHIRSMPFIWLEIDDEPGPDSLRGYIERNSIALLSNYHRQRNPVDPQSSSWLGQWAISEKVRNSGLWNSNHVDQNFDMHFLNTLESLI